MTRRRREHTFRSDSITYLGAPSSAGPYAQNPWVAEIFDGRLYTGSANASNSGPNPNAGPVPVLAYNIATGVWATEATLQEKQLGAFEVIDGSLVIPGMDRITGFISSWYRLESGIWVQHQTMQNTLHVYRIKKYGSIWYSGMSGSASGFAVATSPDDGATWTLFKVPTNVAPTGAYPIRGFEVFKIGSDIFINTSVFSVSGSGYMGVKVSGSDFIPALQAFWFFGNKLARPVQFGNDVVCLDVTINNDHQWIPNGAVAIHSDYTVDALDILNGDRVQDFKVVGSQLYALCNRANGSLWDVYVTCSDDLVTWKIAAYLGTFAAFGRSLAINQGVAYIGLGGDTTASGLAQAQIGQWYSVELSA